MGLGGEQRWWLSGLWLNERWYTDRLTNKFQPLFNFLSLIILNRFVSQTNADTGVLFNNTLFQTQNYRLVIIYSLYTKYGRSIHTSTHFQA